jgi:hypothetical protein
MGGLPSSVFVSDPSTTQVKEWAGDNAWRSCRAPHSPVAW